MNMFQFTLASPPTDEQFKAISQQLLASLSDRMGVAFEATATGIESGRWVTVKIRSHPIQQHLINVVLWGVVSHSLREATPSIQSILLPFSCGRRLSVGKDTILLANYVEDEAGGGWDDFAWSFDEYGEWECDELPPFGTTYGP